MNKKNKVDNKKIFDNYWKESIHTSLYAPTCRFIRHLIFDLLKILQKEDIKSVLDLGCGDGTNAYYLANYFKEARIKGTDFSKSGIEAAKSRWKKNNLEFLYDLNNDSLNFHYDLITSSEVLEHVEEWQPLLKKMARASTYLLLSFPTGRMRDYEITQGHVRNFKKGEVEDFLLKLNYKPVKIFYAGFPFFSPVHRDFCNIVNPMTNPFTKGYFGIKQKLISSFLYFLFRFLSTKNRLGEQFCGLFKKTN